MTSHDLVLFEVEHFKKRWDKKINFANLNENSLNDCIANALSDALKQGARRKSVRYRPILNKIKNEFRDDFFEVAKGTKLINSKFDFENLFKAIKKRFLTLLVDNGLKDLSKFGFAQKFINMTFKYLYCFDDCNKENLKFCHLPLDK